jgi:hypothetical protein
MRQQPYTSITVDSDRPTDFNKDLSNKPESGNMRRLCQIADLYAKDVPLNQIAVEGKHMITEIASERSYVVFGLV